MTTLPIRNASSNAASGFARPVGDRGAVQTIVATLAAWQGRRRQRRALAQLDDRLLQDIGFNRDHARREADKGFWVA